MEIVALFCDIADFCLQFEPAWRQRLVAEGKAQLVWASRLCLSEGLTIGVSFHQSGSRTCKAYFLRYVTPHRHEDFPHLVSYSRVVELRPAALVPRCAYRQTRKGQSQGGAFGDATLLAVCPPKRSTRPKVVAGFAAWGKRSLGWTSGFKLHLLLHDLGERGACCLTAAKVDDRKPVPRLVKGLDGKVFGDRGYISPALFTSRFAQGGS